MNFISFQIQKATACLTQGLEEMDRLVASFPVTVAPSAAQLQSLVAPVAAHLATASELGRGPRSPWSYHTKTVSEGIQGFGWLVYSGPACGMHH